VIHLRRGASVHESIPSCLFPFFGHSGEFLSAFDLQYIVRGSYFLLAWGQTICFCCDPILFSTDICYNTFPSLTVCSRDFELIIHLAFLRPVNCNYWYCQFVVSWWRGSEVDSLYSLACWLTLFYPIRDH
jgi:hypothetical protein